MRIQENAAFRNAARHCRAGILAVLFALLLTHVGARAQGAPLESLFDDAQRFLDRQRRNIERELEKLSDQKPPRPAEDIAEPPLPVVNPRRLADPGSAPAQEKTYLPRDQWDRRVGQPPAVTANETVAAGPDTPLPPRNPLRVKEGEDAEPPPPHPREVEAEDWTAEQIAAAKAECEAAMSGLDVQYTPLEPIREGQCGAPYPIKLSSLGKEPAVKISPPATLTCAMAAVLSRWLDETVQPAAAEHLATRIVRLRNVASYVCRTRYSNPTTRISEHALANALDIAAFTTETGETVMLSAHWVLTRTVEADPPQSGVPAGVDNADHPEKTETKEKPPAEPVPESVAHKTDVKAEKAETPETEQPSDPKDDFLHALHEGACAVFGTVLGPEANVAHRDHFHLDMKERRHSAFCE